MFLQVGCIEFVGSDGHELEKRPVSLQNARRLIMATCGPLEPRSDGVSISAPLDTGTASTSTWKRIGRVFTGKA